MSKLYLIQPMYLDLFVLSKESLVLHLSVNHYHGKLQSTSSSQGLQCQESSLVHLDPIFMALGNFSSYISWLKFRCFIKFHWRCNFVLFYFLKFIFSNFIFLLAVLCVVLGRFCGGEGTLKCPFSLIRNW